MKVRTLPIAVAFAVITICSVSKKSSQQERTLDHGKQVIERTLDELRDAETRIFVSDYLQKFVTDTAQESPEILLAKFMGITETNG